MGRYLGWCVVYVSLFPVSLSFLSSQFPVLGWRVATAFQRIKCLFDMFPVLFEMHLRPILLSCRLRT